MNQRSTTLCLTLVIFYYISIPTNGANFHVVDPDSGHIAILLDTDYNITIEAIKSNQVVEVKFVTSDELDIDVEGIIKTTLRVIYLHYPRYKGLQFIINYGIPNYYVAVMPFFSFVPSTLFENIHDDTYHLFYDPKTSHIKNINDSYRCNKTVTTTYTPDKVQESHYEYRVNVTVSFIQTQGFSIVGDKFGPPEEC